MICTASRARKERVLMAGLHNSTCRHQKSLALAARKIMLISPETTTHRVLDELARVQKIIGVKECLDAVHPLHARTMLFGHEAALHQANAMLTRSRPVPC